MHPASPTGRSYFDVEGDKDQNADPDDGYELTLTWRGDPSETHSDYTIVVVANGLNTATTYHVHKSVLCFGPRHSRYFAKIMLNNPKGGNSAKKNMDKKISSSGSVCSNSNANNATTPNVPMTTVELDQRDADNFPILLDYIYAPSVRMAASERSGGGGIASGNGNDGTILTAASTFTSAYSLFTVPTTESEESSVDCCQTDDNHKPPAEEQDICITTRNAVSLRFLARKFEVDSFMLVVNKFIQTDLHYKTGPTYLNLGWEYQDDRLVKSAQRLCAENFLRLDVESLMLLPVRLFRLLLKSIESFDEENKEQSMFLSDVVCEYMEKNPSALKADVLIELTDPIRMPYIGAEAAIGFTAQVKELESQDASQNWDGLVHLCRRCAKSVVKQYGWNDFCIDAAVEEYLGHSTTRKRVSRVDSLLFATSFASALEQAQEDYEEIIAEQERLEGTVEALSSTIALMESINERKDEHMSKQQRAIEEAKKQIIDMKQQIREIKEQHKMRYQHHMQQEAQPQPQSQPTQYSPPPPPPPQHQHHHSHPATAVRPASIQQQDLTPEEIVRDLVSPGTIIASRQKGKSNNHQNLKSARSKEEMRKMHSLM